MKKFNIAYALLLTSAKSLKISRKNNLSRLEKNKMVAETIFSELNGSFFEGKPLTSSDLSNISNFLSGFIFDELTNRLNKSNADAVEALESLERLNFNTKKQ